MRFLHADWLPGFKTITSPDATFAIRSQDFFKLSCWTILGKLNDKVFLKNVKYPILRHTQYQKNLMNLFKETLVNSKRTKKPKTNKRTIKGTNKRSKQTNERTEKQTNKRTNKWIDGQA